jgi:hypothetical protein
VDVILFVFESKTQHNPHPTLMSAIFKTTNLAQPTPHPHAISLQNHQPSTAHTPPSRRQLSKPPQTQIHPHNLFIPTNQKKKTNNLFIPILTLGVSKENLTKKSPQIKSEKETAVK